MKLKDIMSMQSPITRPKESDLDKIDTDPANCLADAYDIVLNGLSLVEVLNVFTNKTYNKELSKL